MEVGLKKSQGGGRMFVIFIGVKMVRVFVVSLSKQWVAVRAHSSGLKVGWVASLLNSDLIIFI